VATDAPVLLSSPGGHRDLTNRVARPRDASTPSYLCVLARPCVVTARKPLGLTPAHPLRSLRSKRVSLTLPSMTAAGGVYLAAAGAVSFVAALLLPKTARHRLTHEFEATQPR
jgi:hypothetical protein